MGNLIIFAIVIVVVLVIFAAISPKNKGRQRSTSIGFPYHKQKGLFTPAERSFLGVLDREVAGRYRVFGKVRLADVVAVNRGLGASEVSAARNRISQKHVDFVLCNHSDLSIVAVLELDDKSHQRLDRQERDDLLTAVCGAAGLKLIRFPVKTAYTAAEVGDALFGLDKTPTSVLPPTAG